MHCTERKLQIQLKDTTKAVLFRICQSIIIILVQYCISHHATNFVEIGFSLFNKNKKQLFFSYCCEKNRFYCCIVRAQVFQTNTVDIFVINAKHEAFCFPLQSQLFLGKVVKGRSRVIKLGHYCDMNRR